MKDRVEAGIPIGPALAVLLAVIALASVPIWTVKYVPIVDYPLHAARAYLLSLPQDGRGITEFYRAHWIPIPNLGMDIVVSTLMKLAEPVFAAKAFLTLVVALMLSGGFALATALNRRITVVAYLPAIALYDQWFLMGFSNYLFGIGLGLWAMAVWVWGERWPARKRALLFGSVCTLIFVCHLMAFIVTLGVAWAFESVRTKGVKTALLGAGAGGSVTCLLAFIALTIAHRTPIDFRGRLSSIVQAVSPQLDGWIWLTVIPILLFLPILPGARMAFDRRAIVAALGLTVVAVLGPTFMGGTAFACDRLTLPAMILALVSLGESSNGSHEDNASVRVARVTLGSLAVGLKAIVLLPYWNQAARASEEVVDALRGLPERSTVVTYQLGEPKGPTWRDLRHVPDWILMEKPVFIAQNFTKPRQQPMRFAPEYEEFHEYQNNNPKTVNDLAELARETAIVRGLQARLAQALAPSGRKPGGAYALVFTGARAELGPIVPGRLVQAGDGFALLELP